MWTKAEVWRYEGQIVLCKCSQKVWRYELARSLQESARVHPDDGCQLGLTAILGKVDIDGDGGLLAVGVDERLVYI